MTSISLIMIACAAFVFVVGLCVAGLRYRSDREEIRRLTSPIVIPERRQRSPHHPPIEHLPPAEGHPVVAQGVPVVGVLDPNVEILQARQVENYHATVVNI